jgi:hypothetical protein
MKDGSDDRENNSLDVISCMECNTGEMERGKHGWRHLSLLGAILLLLVLVLIYGMDWVKIVSWCVLVGIFVAISIINAKVMEKNYPHEGRRPTATWPSDVPPSPPTAF